MKRYILLCLGSLLFTSSSFSQFSSEGFENWENGNPVNWFTSNLATIYVPVTQSTDARSGTYSVRGETIPAQNGTGYPPIISAGNDAKGFPLNFRAAAVTGWFKFHSDSADAFSVSVAVIKNHRAIGSGGYFSTENTSVYKFFSADITYITPDIPDTIQIVILITNSVIRPGASFILDDLSLSSATNLSEIPAGYTYSLQQNYPNPFNPTTSIQFSIAGEEQVTLKVFNSLGSELAILLDESMQPGSYKYEFDAGRLPTGVYYYQLHAGNFVGSRKMLVLK